MNQEIIVSYVVTVYNKEGYVGCTVDSLLEQQGDIPAEYIFVDDVSTDQSLSVIEERTRGRANVSIIRNRVNAGPSVRLNQGVRLARGKYVQFIDSDDVLAANATRVMLELIERRQADLVHGEWEKTNEEGKKLLGRAVAEPVRYVVSDAPMRFVFERRLRRMAQMVRRDTFLAAGGCDENVFIQDESLSIRLARVAKRFVLLKAPVLLIPKVEGELSRNVSQLNHDRFLACCGMLREFPSLDDDMRRKLYRRCLSAAWKQHRLMEGMSALAKPAFRRYMHSRWSLMPVDDAVLEEMQRFFGRIPNVRRAHAP